MKRIIKRVLLVVIIMMAITFLAGCGKKKPIVGSWVYNNYEYTFKSNNKGEYTINSTKKKFKYEDNGEELSIYFDDDNIPVVLPYKIDGKSLIIYDSKGNEKVYTKK